MSPRGKEKRDHQRVPGRITLRTISSDYGTIEMETANLSPGGAYCLSSQSIPPMTKLRLNIFLPSTDGRPAKLHYPIQVDAIVVRSEPLNGEGDGGEGAADEPPQDGDGAYRLALFFADIADKDRLLLSRYLGTTAAS